MHAFSSRLDYCNSLLYGVSDELLRKLQVIQNAATRVVTVAKKFDHITPVLRELHWLPVRERIRFKLAMIVYKCLHGLAPPYLSHDCVLASSHYYYYYVSSVVDRINWQRSREQPSST